MMETPAPSGPPCERATGSGTTLPEYVDVAEVVIGEAMLRADILPKVVVDEDSCMCNLSMEGGGRGAGPGFMNWLSL